jgi:hypothetical protein
MKEEIYFLGFKFTFLQFLLLFLGWSFFLCFIWPVIIGSYFFVSVFVCAFSVVFASLVNNKLILGLLVLFLINKKIVIYYQNFMLFLSAFLGTWVFSWFVPMSRFVFLDHLLINTFSVFLYYTFAVKTGNSD